MTPLAFDIAVGVIILLSIMISYFRGVIREVFTLVGLGLAVYISCAAGPLLKPGIGKWFGATAEGSADHPPMVFGLVDANLATKIVAYGGIFLFVLICMFVLRMLITRWIKEAGLSVVDRLLGAVFGFLRGFLLVFAVYAVCFYLVTEEKLPEWVRGSRSAPVFNKTIAWLDKNFALSERFIKDEGGHISIQLDKVDLDKVGEEVKEKGADAVQDLKDEIKKEESAIEKTPDTAPPPPMDVPPAEGEDSSDETTSPDEDGSEPVENTPPPAGTDGTTP